MSWEKEKRNRLNLQMRKDFWNLIFETDSSTHTFNPENSYYISYMLNEG